LEQFRESLSKHCEANYAIIQLTIFKSAMRKCMETCTSITWLHSTNLKFH